MDYLEQKWSECILPYKLITDATSDLPFSLAQEWDVEVLPMEYTLNGKPYSYCPGNGDQTTAEFFAAMRQGASAITSQINAYTFTSVFEGYLKQGMDVIYAGFSSALSGTVGSARIAQAELAEKYPGRKIAVVDSLCASLGQGLFLYYAARLQKELDFDAMVAWLEANKLHFVHWFTVDDLEYLKRGGRVSGATAAIATVLQIKPVMHVDCDGHLVAVEKVQGRKKSLKALVDHMVASMDKEKADVAFIGHCDAQKEAELVAAQIRERTGIETIVIDDIGVMIGAHSGPGTVALFFYGTRLGA